MNAINNGWTFLCLAVLVVGVLYARRMDRAQARPHADITGNAWTPQPKESRR